MARAVVPLALIAAALAAWLAVREQRDANRRILDTLTEMKVALDQQTRRAGELEQQVAALNDRVVSLEREVVSLRDRVISLSRSRAEIARATPTPLDAVPLTPLSPSPELESPSSVSEAPRPRPQVLETVPITWNTDWTSYQPAGIIAPAPPIVLDRKLTDPAFVKKMYGTLIALQAADVITTTAALRNGAVEANPLLRGAASSPAALIGVKAAVSVTTIVAIEKLRKQHPVAASVTLIAINATMAAVAINNVSVLARSAPPSRR